ncbi:MAG: energy-coupling factor transporter ATPase [Erysipelotrichaceae bacterium]
MKNIISVEKLNFHYDEDTYAVKEVSFDILKGSYTTIIGHNGSGKSTIAKLLIGLLEKDSGEIVVGDLPLTLENLNSIRNEIGIVFQNPDNQFIGSTVRDDIAFGLENHLVDPEKMDSIINRFAESVNMSSYLDHEPTKLSGGQKQRVAIAGALAMNPEIIIFDESTAMLDPTGKAEINKLIKDLHNETKLTIISITHDVEEVIKSDYVLVMDKGSLIMQGAPSEIFKNEKKMIDLNLDIPFSMRLYNQLEKQGITLDVNNDLEGMVDALCQLSLKK